MKSISIDFNRILQGAADGSITPVHLVYFWPKNRSTGVEAQIGYSTLDEPITATVTDGETGKQVTRTYRGGVGLNFSPFKYVSDLTQQTCDISLSQISGQTRQLVQDYDLRLARCEIHSGAFNHEKGQIEDSPVISFLATVDQADLITPPSGGEGRISIGVMSSAIDILTRTNPRKSSYEGQKTRVNDYFSKFSSTVETWQLKWGRS